MNPEEFVEALAASVMIMKINRLYFFLERLDEEYELGNISDEFYLEQSQDVRVTLNRVTEHNPFNQLKEELNLFTL
jgi:hypothetical protein